MTGDKMVGWHHRLNGLEFEQAPGDSEGQGSLACRSARGCKESDMTERLDNTRSLADSCQEQWWRKTVSIRLQVLEETC